MPINRNLTYAVTTGRTRSCAPQEVCRCLANTWGEHFDSKNIVFKNKRDEPTPVEQLATGKGTLIEQGEEDCMNIFQVKSEWRFYQTANYYIWYVPSSRDLSYCYGRSA